MLPKYIGFKMNLILFIFGLEMLNRLYICIFSCFKFWFDFL